MSTIHFRFSRALTLFFMLCGNVAQAQEPLKPFKDDLFSPAIASDGRTMIASKDNGDYELVSYDEARDVNGRDEIPERRVKRQYVSLGVKKMQAAETLDIGGSPLELYRVGPKENAAFTVIFIHGRGGDRRLGVNDYSFGGNFNRLKNLAVGNGGTYLVPSVKRFDGEGVVQIAGLIADAARRAPGRPVVLACASMGSFICWGVTRDAAAVQALGGMMIMGGATDPSFEKSAFHKARRPIYFSHGSRDSVYSSADQSALYDTLHAKGYPVRFTLFETGSHGTPVRMTDWRKALNWILMAR